MHHDHDYVISSIGFQKKWKFQREKRRPKPKNSKTEIEKTVLKNHAGNVMPTNEVEVKTEVAPPNPTTSSLKEKVTRTSARKSSSDRSKRYDVSESAKENRANCRASGTVDKTTVCGKTELLDHSEFSRDVSCAEDESKSERKYDNYVLSGNQSPKPIRLNESFAVGESNDSKRTYQYSFLPHAANQSETAPSKCSKQKRLTNSKWRCASQQPKKKLSRFKWHHTFFERKWPKREKSISHSALPFATPLSEAYQDQKTRDSALEDTLREAPPYRPWKHHEHSADPCLIEADKPIVFCVDESLPATLYGAKTCDDSDAIEIDDRFFSDLVCGSTDDVVDIDSVFGEISSIRNYESDDDGLVTRDDKQLNVAADFRSTVLISESEDKTSQDNMEAMEVQTTPVYTQQTSSVFDESTQFFSDLDEDIFSNFFDGTTFIDDFVNENTLETILNTIDFDESVASPVSMPTDMGFATSDSLINPTPSTPHKYSHEVLESATLTQFSDCYPEGYSSPADSGFNSPETVASPLSDVCSWKNDLETHDYQSYFKYTVVPSSASTSPIKVRTAPEVKTIKEEPQFLNMDDQGQVHSSVERSSSASSVYDACAEPMQSDSSSSWTDLSSSSDTSNDSKTVSLPKKEVAEKAPSKPHRPPGTRRPSDKGKNPLLWEFIRDILLNPEYCPSLIKWEDRSTGLFRFVQSDVVAAMWGKQKENTNMTYEKLSRAMRYYYNRGILERVDGRRLVYKFGPNSHGWQRRASECDVRHESIVPSLLSKDVKNLSSAPKSKPRPQHRVENEAPKIPYACKKELPTVDARLTDCQHQLPSACVLLDRKSRIATA